MKVAGEKPSENTEALHYLNEAQADGKIVLIHESDNNLLLVADRTPFHPEDYSWKDQPGDKGIIRVGNVEFVIKDTMAWPIPKLGDILPPDQITISRPDDAHVITIAHVIDGMKIDGNPANFSDINADNLIGQNAHFEVDQSYRRELNVAHTAAHLMSFALNKHTALFWKKETRQDSLGNPNLDANAIAKSKIYPNKSEDTYRFGKSLRKSGFMADDFVGNLGAVSEEMNKTVNAWIAQASPVSLEGDSLHYGTRRTWKTVLDGKEVSIPCGGTHVKNLSEIGSVEISLQYDPEEKSLVILSNVLPKNPQAKLQLG